MALTADDLRRQAYTSRMQALMGAGGRERVPMKRQPRRPSGAPALETPRPSTAGDVAGVVGTAGGAALGIAAAIGLNPILGSLLGLVVQQSAGAIGRNIAAGEQQENVQIQMRNQRAMGEAAREQQQYERRLAEQAPVLPQQRGVAPQGDMGYVEPGAAEKLKRTLVGV